jgi:hypothetical protein
MAPAASASDSSRFIAAISAAVGASVNARSPMA